VLSKKAVKLVIVGVGPQEGFLKALVCKLGIEEHVQFVIGKRAYSYYPLFDCFVQPSLTEGLSIALLEAMSFSLVCVVTHVGGAHPVIRHKENGILVTDLRTKSPRFALVRSLLELIGDNAGFAKNIREKAKKSVLQSFCAGSMVAQYRTTFKSFSNSK